MDFANKQDMSVNTLKTISLVSMLVAFTACNSEEETAATDSTNSSDSFGQNTPIPPSPVYMPVPFSTQAPVRLSLDQIDSIATESGWVNPSNKFIFVNGRIQLFLATTRCSNADLEIKWTASAPWMRLQHYFVERNAFIETSGGQPGNGYSVSTQFFLPAGGRVRVNFGTNPNCRDSNNMPSGALYLGGESDGVIPEEQILDWSYLAVN